MLKIKSSPFEWFYLEFFNSIDPNKKFERIMAVPKADIAKYVATMEVAPGVDATNKFKQGVALCLPRALIATKENTPSVSFVVQCL
jgi:hypothetical protein